MRPAPASPLISAALMAALITPAPLLVPQPAAAAAQATVLGRLDARLGGGLTGKHISYRTSDSADAGSGWEARGKTRVVSILWKGPKPTDLMLMELTLTGDTPTAARLVLPEASQGVLEAKAPKNLNVTLSRAATNGSWLKLKGRATGIFYPLRRRGSLLPDDGVKVTVRFDTWVPGIFPPAPAKPAHMSKSQTSHAISTAPALSPRPQSRFQSRSQPQSPQEDP